MEFEDNELWRETDLKFQGEGRGWGLGVSEIPETFVGTF